MVYEVRVKQRFNAVHALPLPDGESEPLHGHDWLIEAVFQGERLDECGMLVDFLDVQAALGRVAGTLDHTNLNDQLEAAYLPSSAEHVARWIYDNLRDAMGPDVPIAGVYVTEAPNCVAGYLNSVR